MCTFIRWCALLRLCCRRFETDIIHIDAYRAANRKKTISDIIAEVLFEKKEVRFKSHFTARAQFGSNSCSVWLMTAMVGYVHSLPKPSVRNDALISCLVYLIDRINFEMKMLSLKFLF